MTRTAVIALVFAVGALLPMHAAEARPGPSHVKVVGTWVSPDPAVIQSVTPEGASLRILGTSHSSFHGGVEGTTEFSMNALLDPATGALQGTIDETFTGSVATVGTGTLRFTEEFTITGDGTLVLDAHVVSGTGALTDVRGNIHFVGTSDPVGVSSGTYQGQLRVRCGH